MSAITARLFHVFELLGRLHAANITEDIGGIYDSSPLRGKGGLKLLRVTAIGPVAEHFQPDRAGKPAGSSQFLGDELQHAHGTITVDSDSSAETLVKRASTSSISVSK